MPQIFQVLRCYKCFVFQVHQTKKSNKWDCKLCGEKQSIKRHYGLGTAKDCRLHVQRLNGLRGEIDELKDSRDSENSDSDDHVPPTIKAMYQPLQDSKWLNYTEETQTVEENSNENMSLEGAEVVLEIPKKRRKTFNNSFKKQVEVQENLNYKTSTIEIIPDYDEDNIRVQSVSSIPDKQPIDLYQQKENFKTSKSSLKNKFIMPVLNKNSKWTQFTENAEQTEHDIAPTSSITASQSDLLFSLCDDSDLDNVLDI